MKTLKDDDLAGVHGGAETPATSGSIAPYAVTPPATALPDGTQMPPTLPEKQVER